MKKFLNYCLEKSNCLREKHLKNDSFCRILFFPSPKLSVLGLFLIFNKWVGFRLFLVRASLKV